MLMNDAENLRRFACHACGHIHGTWTHRCETCLSLAGLSLVRAVATVAATAPTDVPSPPPTQDVPRATAWPPLAIARPPVVAEPLIHVGDSEEEPVPLSEISEESFERVSTGLAPLDHVLGGGLVRGSVVLLASPPGIGKTSLTLQMLHGLGHRSLYVTGEETKAQLKETARRVGATSRDIFAMAARDLDRILAHAQRISARTIAIDSIQKMVCGDLDGRAGTTGQLKECTARLVQYAKQTNTSLWLIGHVTSDGSIAGPKTIEHDVDVVLELEPGAGMEGNERLLRCPSKNRFGATSVVGRFEVTAQGFVCVDGDGWNEKL
jgi:DNA repair protein RadA/Sms